MKCANFNPFVLLCYLSTNMQLSSLRIEVDRGNSNKQGDVDTGGRCAACRRFGRYSTDGRRTEKVSRGDKIVGVPLSYRLA